MQRVYVQTCDKCIRYARVTDIFQHLYIWWDKSLLECMHITCWWLLWKPLSVGLINGVFDWFDIMTARLWLPHFKCLFVPLLPAARR